MRQSTCHAPADLGKDLKKRKKERNINGDTLSLTFVSLYTQQLTWFFFFFLMLVLDLNLPYPKMMDMAVPANMVCGLQDLTVQQIEQAKPLTTWPSKMEGRVCVYQYIVVVLFVPWLGTYDWRRKRGWYCVGIDGFLVISASLDCLIIFHYFRSMQNVNLAHWSNTLQLQQF